MKWRRKSEEGENEAKKGEEGDTKEKKEGGGDGGAAPAGGSEEDESGKEVAVQDDPKFEMKKNEFYYDDPQNYQVYPQRYAHEMYNPYLPQMFSDENTQ